MKYVDRRYLSGLLVCLILLCYGIFLPAAVAQRVDSTFQADIRKYATLYSVVARSDGSYLVLGRHQYTDAVLTGNLTCLRADGTVNQDFQRNLVSLGLSSIYSAGANPKLLPYADGRILVVAQEKAVVAAAPQSPARLIRLLASGRPDSSFVDTSQTFWPVVRTAVLQPDGKILLGGSASATGALLIRLNADGSLDQTFAPSIGMGNSREFVSSVALQPDGRIVVAGFFGAPAAALIRLLPNGQLDGSFQAGVAAGHNVQQVLLRTDGRIVVGGPANLLIQGRTGGIQQLLPDGQLDGTFLAPSALGIKNENAEVRLTLMANGRLLVLPSAPATAAPIIRLSSSGALDANFQVPSSVPLNIQQAIPDVNGRILLMGSYTHNPGPMGTVHRLLPDGVPDPVFRPQLTVPGRVMSQLRLPDGRVVLAGTFDQLDDTRAGNIACLLPNGKVDTAFARRSPFLNGTPERLARQPSGNLLVGGSFKVGTTTRGSLVRLLATGVLDTTFLRYMAGYPVSSLAVQPDGRIIIGGQLATGFSSLNAARLLPNGPIDNSFRISITLSDWLRDVRHILVEPDGRVLLAGNQVHRVLANGQYDPTYNAKVLNTYTNLLVYDMKQQPDGRLTLCGQMPGYGGAARTTIVRLMPAGSVDSTFQDPLYQYFSPRKLYYQPDGKLLVGGFYAPNITTGTLGLLRLESNGGYDNTLLTLPGYGDVASISADGQGRILLGGEFYYKALTSQQRLSLMQLVPAQMPLATTESRNTTSCTLYPNPAQEWLRVTYSGSDSPQRLRIISLTGRLIKEVAIQSKQPEIWVGDVASGVYVVQVAFRQKPPQTYRVSITH